jgi:predicted DNA-binding transcriptional regulator AlpA
MRSFVFRPELEELIGLNRSTIYRQERAGKFPRRFVVGERKVAWDRLEIETYIKTKMAARPGAAAPAPPRRRRRRGRR